MTTYSLIVFSLPLGANCEREFWELGKINVMRREKWKKF